MKVKLLLILFLQSYILSQFDIGANYELKYFDGEDESSDIFEHYLDLNMYYKDLFFYSSIRYKDPALIGIPTKSFNDIYDIFYFEYYNENMQLQLGDIFQSYGSGLSFLTFEDKAIDYNNSLRGINLTYYLRDDLEMFSTLGVNDFTSRTSPSILEPNLNIGNDVAILGFNFQGNNFDLTYLSKFNNQKIDSNTINNMKNSFDNSLGHYLEYRYQNSDDIQDFEQNIFEHNIGTTIYFSNIEFFIEKSLIYHNKIGGERIMDSRLYFNSYFSTNGYGILYEYKNYNTPYLFSVFSNPPIVFRESNSTLISRNLHNIDFNNEIGHHLKINKSFSDQINIVFSTACSYLSFFDDKTSSISFDKVLSDMLFQSGKMEEYSDLKPYRQMYFEINGIDKNDKFFYKIGLDKYLEYANGKIIDARTIPTQFTYKMRKGNSISAYLEVQTLNDISSLDKKYYTYFSPSYNHYGKWILSLFGDFTMDSKLLGMNEIKDGFIGADFTYYISNNNILSLFIGSQKGGLVCSNGTCVVQPDFNKGFKITSKFIF